MYKCLNFDKVCLRACGATDNASDYGSEDSRFESWQARNIFTSFKVFLFFIRTLCHWKNFPREKGFYIRTFSQCNIERPFQNFHTIWYPYNRISENDLSKIMSSPAGNRTPVSRVTGGDTNHYTTEDLDDSDNFKYINVKVLVKGEEC